MAANLSGRLISRRSRRLLLYRHHRKHTRPMAADTDPALSDEVTVCICTYRRETVRDAILSVARLTEVNLSRLKIVVIDNDELPSAENVVREAAETAGMPVAYVHAPMRNISIARNAALDAVTTRWMAFIDDDEVAAPDWLRCLLDRKDGVEVVVGRSQAIYGADQLEWLEICDFHSNAISGSPVNAYTCNVLLDASFVRTHGVRFALELGQTGGEDTMFFHELHTLGARFAYAPESVVFEDVPKSRASMRWVLRRKFRSGQTHALLLRRFFLRSYFFLPATAGAKCAVSAFVAGASWPFTNRWRVWAARAALHLGAASYPVFGRALQEYRAPG